MAGYQLNKGQLEREISAAGLRLIGETDYYGVPCLEVELPLDEAIFQICRKVPTLNAFYLETREAIAIMNGLNPFYPRSQRGRQFDTVRKTILIPLDTTIQPKLFPSSNGNFASYAQAIFVDREKQALAYYEHGQLVACFPVSTGRSGKGTPAMQGWIKLKDEDHISSIYDVLMPFSLLLASPYFVHAGVMPGMPDSAGCIRMFTEHARWLFDRIESRKTRFKVA